MSIQVISLTEHSFCFSRDDACSVLVTTSSKHLSVSRAHFCTENSILIQYYGRKKVCWVSLKLLPFPKLYPAKYFLFFSTLLSCCLVSCWVRPIIGIIKRLKQKKKKNVWEGEGIIPSHTWLLVPPMSQVRGPPPSMGQNSGILSPPLSPSVLGMIMVSLCSWSLHVSPSHVSFLRLAHASMT